MILVVILVSFLAMAIGSSFVTAVSHTPQVRSFEIRAFRWGFEPSTIVVNQGDEVILTISAEDSVHGFYIDGAKVEDIIPGEPKSINFTASTPGRIKFRCATICGALHPFMVGDLVIQPNSRFPTLAFGAAGVYAVALVLITQRKSPSTIHLYTGWRLDLLRIGLLKRIVKSRILQPLLQYVNFIVFMLIILAGLFGVGLGARNLAIVITWIVWWVLLMVVLIPFFGRAWCAICPIVWPAETLQRGSWSKLSRSFTLNRRWPKILSNSWLSNLLFTVIAMWLVVEVTHPFETSVTILILVVGAIVVSLIFSRRAFCRYVCPIGGTVGVYSTFAPLELRVRDTQVCVKGGCKKDCYVGNERGYGCPWFEFPQTMDRNVNCGLCTECIKTCPSNNIALNLRPFGADLLVQGKRSLDEASRVLIMMSLAIFFTAVLQGPWSWLKIWGNHLFESSSVGLPQHIFFGLLVFDIALGLGPCAHLLTSWASKSISGVKSIPVKTLFTHYAYTYIPLGITMWMSFSLTLLLLNWSYIPVVLSDPFGFGWNLFGTRDIEWTPISWPISPIVTGLSLIGMIFSLKVGYSISEQILPDKESALKAFLPVSTLVIIVSITYLSLLV